jgi:hypothetical protein
MRKKCTRPEECRGWGVGRGWGWGGGGCGGLGLGGQAPGAPLGTARPHRLDVGGPKMDCQ